MSDNLPAQKSEGSPLDPSNPRSVINLVPTKVKQAILDVPQEFLSMSEDELRELTPNKEFTRVDELLRTSFWLEYERAQTKNSRMSPSNIVGGVCSYVNFYTRVLTNPVRTAYLLIPPLGYRIAMEEALQLGLKKLREILTLQLDEPVVDRKGQFLGNKTNVQLADLQVKAFALIDTRLKGAVVQRVDSRNINVNLEEKREVREFQTVEELERELAKYENAGVVKSDG